MVEESHSIRGEHTYKQHVTSAEEHEERLGRSLVTTDHDVIRQWAEERDARPATAPDSEHGGRPGRLVLDFPDYSGEKLEPISWDEWFTAFEERRLNFIYQEHKTDGAVSTFFQLQNADENAE